jgi:hypothetical protein
VKQDAVRSFGDESLKKNRDGLEAPYLSNVLAHQEEVIPIPSGDRVVHYGAWGWILKAFTTS